MSRSSFYASEGPGQSDLELMAWYLAEMQRIYDDALALWGDMEALYAAMQALETDAEAWATAAQSAANAAAASATAAENWYNLMVNGTLVAGALEYDPADLNDWLDATDPGMVGDALDQLADRLSSVEVSFNNLSWKQRVRAASTADATFSTAFDNGSVLDGVTLATGDRILIKDQTDQTKNGIYIVQASGAPVRATDADGASELVNATVYVSEGDTQADTMWTCTTNATITVGATNLVFAQLSGGGGTADQVEYTPTTPADWDVEPVNVLEALDELAGRMEAAEAAATLKQSIIIAASDETTPITTGTAKVTFRMPYAFTLTDIRASLVTAQTSGSVVTVDVNESGTSLMSTKLTFDNTEKTTTTAATARVLSDTLLGDDNEITIDVDQVGDGTAKGLKVMLIGKPGTPGAESFVIPVTDETTAITAGTNKLVFRMPYAFTLTGIRASLSTAQTSGNIFTVDVNEGGASILSTKLTIDNTEKTSTTAATAAVISDAVLADDAEISIDVDQIGDGTAKGLKLTLIGYRP